MRSFPTLEPVIVNGGSFVIERLLDRAGEVDVVVGDKVTPETTISRSESIDKPVTIYVANELAVENESLKKYLTKSIGASVSTGDVIARVRRGLRTASVRAPVDGTLVNVDESHGTVILSASVGPHELRSLVHGTVDQVIHGQGAILRATGDRFYGIVGFGGEAIGELVIGNDRHDREFTPDHVESEWSGKIVLAGMTLGVPALQKLADANIAGVIVGSIAEADIRRFVSPVGLSEAIPVSSFWQTNRTSNQQFSDIDYAPPFVIVVTEGFGRQPMAAPLFETLRRHDGESISVSASTELSDRLARPEMYLTQSGDGSPVRLSDEIVAGRTVRVNDPSHVGTIGTTATDSFVRISLNGRATQSVMVTMPSGESRIVPIDNLEVIS